MATGLGVLPLGVLRVGLGAASRASKARCSARGEGGGEVVRGEGVRVRGGEGRRIGGWGGGE